MPVAMKVLWPIAVITIIFDVASVVACTWLLCDVGCRRERRLFSLQLVNLAVADALCSTAQAVNQIFRICDYTPFAQSPDRQFAKEPGLDLMTFTQCQSMWLDVHIAAGFLALYWRLPRLMQMLKKTLLLTWVIPILFFCVLKYGGAREFRITFDVCTLLPFVIACVLYFMAWFRSWWFPLREQQRAHRMVWLYPAIFLFTMAPTVVAIAYQFESDFNAPFMALKGLLNVLVYRCHSRFSCAMWNETTEAPRMPVMQWGGLSSVPVGFSLRSPDVLRVAAVQGAALQESEKEIAEIERVRAAATEDV